MDHSTLQLELPHTWQLASPTVSSQETKAEDTMPFIAYYWNQTQSHPWFATGHKTTNKILIINEKLHYLMNTQDYEHISLSQFTQNLTGVLYIF